MHRSIEGGKRLVRTDTLPQDHVRHEHQNGRPTCFPKRFDKSVHDIYPLFELQYQLTCPTAVSRTISGHCRCLDGRCSCHPSHFGRVRDSDPTADPDHTSSSALSNCRNSTEAPSSTMNTALPPEQFRWVQRKMLRGENVCFLPGMLDCVPGIITVCEPSPLPTRTSP